MEFICVYTLNLGKRNEYSRQAKYTSQDFKTENVLSLEELLSQ